MPRTRRKTIGTLGERSLHARLKRELAQPGDKFEVPLDGYWIDIVRGDLLIEVQTTAISTMRDKLRDLTQRHRVHVVHPISSEKWILSVDGDGEIESRRKSPRHKRVEHIFDALVGCPDVMALPNFTLEVLLVREEEVRRPRKTKTRWGRTWAPADHRLLEIVERHSFNTPRDLMRLLPRSLPREFTSADLAHHAELPIDLAQRMTYCLRNMGTLELVGKRGHALLHRR